MSTENKAKHGTPVALAVTALQSLTSSATVGWKSVMVDDSGAGSINALDYQIFVKLTTANTAPASDKAMYVYVDPWYYDGSTWYSSDGGTATLPTSADAGYTIASPNALKLGMVMPYTTAQMVCQGMFNLSSAFGLWMPAGFSIIIINFSGATRSTGCIVDYTPITETNA